MGHAPLSDLVQKRTPHWTIKNKDRGFRIEKMQIPRGPGQPNSGIHAGQRTPSAGCHERHHRRVGSGRKEQPIISTCSPDNGRPNFHFFELLDGGQSLSTVACSKRTLNAKDGFDKEDI